MKEPHGLPEEENPEEGRLEEWGLPEDEVTEEEKQDVPGEETGDLYRDENC